MDTHVAFELRVETTIRAAVAAFVAAAGKPELEPARKLREEKRKEACCSIERTNRPNQTKLLLDPTKVARTGSSSLARSFIHSLIRSGQLLVRFLYNDDIAPVRRLEI